VEKKEHRRREQRHGLSATQLRGGGKIETGWQPGGGHAGGAIHIKRGKDAVLTLVIKWEPKRQTMEPKREIGVAKGR